MDIKNLKDVSEELIRSCEVLVNDFNVEQTLFHKVTQNLDRISQFDELIRCNRTAQHHDCMGRFDELARYCYRVLNDGVTFKKELLNIMIHQYENIHQAHEECKQWKMKFDLADNDLKTARQKQKSIELERDVIACNLENLRRIILNDPNRKVSDKVKANVVFLDSSNLFPSDDGQPRLSQTIAKHNSMSDASFSNADDNLDTTDNPMTLPSEESSSIDLGDKLWTKKQKLSNNMCSTSPLSLLPSTRSNTPRRLHGTKKVNAGGHSSISTESVSAHPVNIQCHNFINRNFFKLKSHSLRKRKVENTNGEKLSQCHICEKKFSRSVDLHNHILIHKEGRRLFGCDICGKRFTWKTNLRRHILIHKGDVWSRRLYGCDICEKRFTQKSSLRTHMFTHEQGLECMRPFSCDICGKRFTRKTNLRCHILIHAEGIESRRRFSCDVCEKRFTQKSLLKAHIFSHERETGCIRPFSCDICGKRFVWKKDLRRHIPIHEGDIEYRRPFGCDICGKRFTWKTNLRQHILIHEEDIECRCPFVCDICGKRFTRKTSIRKHIILIHEGDGLGGK